MARQRVSRQGREFSAEELRELAGTLACLEADRDALYEKVNGRVLVAWLDPLLSAGKGHKFYNDMRAALDEEWERVTGGTAGTPFYGAQWQALKDAAARMT